MKQTDNLIFKLGNRTSTSQRGYTSGQNTGYALHSWSGKDKYWDPIAHPPEWLRWERPSVGENAEQLVFSYINARVAITATSLGDWHCALKQAAYTPWLCDSTWVYAQQKNVHMFSKQTCTRMFLAILFVTAHRRNSEPPPMAENENKVKWSHTLESYPELRMKEPQWGSKMNLTNMVLSKKSAHCPIPHV